jgi:hypothetical protein
LTKDTNLYANDIRDSSRSEADVHIKTKLNHKINQDLHKKLYRPSVGAQKPQHRDTTRPIPTPSSLRAHVFRHLDIPQSLMLGVRSNHQAAHADKHPNLALYTRA